MKKAADTETYRYNSADKMKDTGMFNFIWGISVRKIKITQIGTSRNSHGNFIRESIVKQNDIFDVIGYALLENEREKIPRKYEGI